MQERVRSEYDYCVMLETDQSTLSMKLPLDAYGTNVSALGTRFLASASAPVDRNVIWEVIYIYTNAVFNLVRTLALLDRLHLYLLLTHAKPSTVDSKK